MGGFKKGIWIARDQNGALYAYVTKPKIHTTLITKTGVFVSTGETIRLSSSWYKNIKFENSPVFIPLPEDFVKQFIKK